MTREEAIESIKKSLTQGDETMKSKTWSGGGFKAEAIRTLLAVIEAPTKACQICGQPVAE